MKEKNSPQQGNVPNASSSIQFISIMDLFHIIRQRWILGSSFGIVVAALFAFYFLNQTPQYEAEASMVVELNTDNVVNVQEVVESGVQNSSLLETAMNTHIARLRSRTLAQIVVDSLDADQVERLMLAVVGPVEGRDPEVELPDPASLLTEDILRISWLPDSQVLSVRIKLADRHMAKLIADRYVNRYIRLQSELRGQSTDIAVNFLDEQTVELRDRLEKEEGALQKYRAENDLVTVEQNQLIVTERLSELSSAITKTRLRLLGVESRLSQIGSAGEDLDLLMNIALIGGRENVTEIYTELQRLRKEEQVLSKTYLERHPKMVENAASQEAVTAALWTAINQARSEFKGEQQAVTEELASLETKYYEAEQEARRLESLSIEYRVLSRKVEAQRDIFDRVTSRFNETSIAQQMNLTTIRILDLAALPKHAVWPDKKKIGLASVMLCGFFFVGVPFGIEFLDNRLRTFSDIERFVGKPVLGDVRLIKGKSDVEIAELAQTKDDLLGEAFASIYGSLRLSLGQFPSPLSLVVTSSVPSEGKSVIASNLAAELAAHGMKTIVVDCDLRRPSQHRYHNLENKQGLIEWLHSGAPVAEDLFADEKLGVQKLGESGKLFLLSSGGSTTHASAVLEDKRMDTLVSRLKQEFELIIFDTPPVGVFHDATLVADYADHCLFVARQNETTRQKTRHSVAQMDRSKAPVLGVVFNGVKDLRLAAGYGSAADYGYESYSYRYQYGYGKHEDQYQKDYASGGA
ncbi:polysaccharide biosynthesis tyrosine autokinase [Coraliomargarita sp. SDUM461003]|uniref:Polysaccharide biosynthesis tyrosine autokinase n=1 Tax=Thalassobacterium maritimum TaxID=3041265 RepID=A0ABU1AVM8_9BACT|nr:polysaccharide biosynthesis tyrosine autokinase [Coraliomargarita sp. SDUM461003]MDQ8208211.1 polysaccharide biosynthesis tyrosine autokinase [Coraliomargarita sp. SDUM461003]